MQATICNPYTNVSATGVWSGPVIQVPLNESWIITALHFQNDSNMNLRVIEILVNEKVVAEYSAGSHDPLLILGIPVTGGSVIKVRLNHKFPNFTGTYVVGISVDRKILG
ncbi:MAG: hypothetical protein WC294_09960 [Methanoregula sp.]|jgi:hypothetical protein